ncbi:MAG: sialidase family protein [Parachlamydiales bacterium]|jgi:hypothetical protein
MKKILIFFIFLINYSYADVNWSETINLSPLGYNAINAQIAINKLDGEAVAVWEIFDGETNVIQFSYSSNSLQKWSDPILLTQSDQISQEPKIAITDDGKIIVIFRKFDGNYYRITQIHTLENFQAWSEQVYLSDEKNHACDADIALTSSGDAVITWVVGDQIQIKKSSNNFQDWSEIFAITESGCGVSKPLVVINDFSEAIIIWGSYDWNKFQIKESHSSDSIQSWSLPISLSDVVEKFEYKMITNGSDVIVAFSTYNKNSRVKEIHSLNNLQNWSLPVVLSEEDYNSDDFDCLCINKEAVVIWKKNNGLHDEICFTKSSDGLQNWSAPQNLSGSENILYSPKICTKNMTEVLVSWRKINESKNLIVQETDSSNDIRDWSTPIDLSALENDNFKINLVSDDVKMIAYWMGYVDLNLVLQLKFSR